MLTLGSLFDGSGGFPLAGTMNGFEPLWASEVEPYPIAVTRSRFPQMLHLGNVCDVNGAMVKPVDVITFGSPCQSLSVAGKREGLRHTDLGDDETTRSGLFMEAVRIITEMREATNGRYPTFAVWENVPGALSSSGGDDFLAVLENLAKIADPEVSIPKPDKWCANGEIVGNGFSIAWRIIDARHFGVTVRDGDTGDVLVRGTPQRRRRIYLVADFRGARAGKILFECAGVPGNSEPCAETRQGAAADAERSVGADDNKGTAKLMDAYQHHGWRESDTVGTLTTGQNNTVRGDTPLVCYGISAYESNAMKSSNPHSGIYEADTSRTLDLNGGNPACNQGGIMVVDSVPYTLKIRSGCEGGGKGALVQKNKSATLATNNDQYLFQPTAQYLFENHSQDTRFKGPQGDGVNEDVSFTCNTTDRHAVAYVESYQKVTGPLMANSHPGSYCGQDAYSDMLITPVPCRQGGFADYVENEVGTFQNTGIGWWKESPVAETIRTPRGGDSMLANVRAQKTKKRYLIRRLTPTECARLQGFPDNWGHPDVKTELTDEEYTFWQTVRDTHAEINGKPQKTYTREQMLKWYNNLHTDSAEYKMWGNGIALPCAHFVLNRIAKELTNHDNQNPTADA